MATALVSERLLVSVVCCRVWPLRRGPLRVRLQALAPQPVLNQANGVWTGVRTTPPTGCFGRSFKTAATYAVPSRSDARRGFRFLCGGGCLACLPLLSESASTRCCNLPASWNEHVSRFVPSHLLLSWLRSVDRQMPTTTARRRRQNRNIDTGKQRTPGGRDRSPTDHNDICEVCDSGGDLLCCDFCNLVSQTTNLACFLRAAACARAVLHHSPPTAVR